MLHGFYVFKHSIHKYYQIQDISIHKYYQIQDICSSIAKMLHLIITNVDILVYK